MVVYCSMAMYDNNMVDFGAYPFFRNGLQSIREQLGGCWFSRRLLSLVLLAAYSSGSDGSNKLSQLCYNFKL